MRSRYAASAKGRWAWRLGNDVGKGMHGRNAPGSRRLVARGQANTWR
jgi:hypothetical protein